MPEPRRSGLTVVTVLDDTQNLGYQDLRRSCQKHGIPINSLISTVKLGHTIGFGARLTLMHAYVDGQCHADEIVLFVDAFDVLFATSSGEIERRYHDLVRRNGKPVIVSAETVCWPDGDRAGDYPLVDTPYKYVNAGTYIGRAGNLRDLLPSQIANSTNDQRWLTDVYLNGDSPIQLDTGAEIFQCLTGVDQSHLQYVDGVWRNQYTGTTPCVFHGNGRGRQMFLETIGPTLLP